MMNLNKVADNLENDVEIKILVDLTADETVINSLERHYEFD